LLSSLGVTLNERYLINYYNFCLKRQEQYIVEITNLKILNNEAMCDFTVVSNLIACGGEDLISAANQRFNNIIKYEFTSIKEFSVCENCNKFCRQQCRKLTKDVVYAN